MAVIKNIIKRGVSFAFGFFSLSLVVGIAAIRDGVFTSRRKMTNEEEKELADDQNEFWDLSISPFAGFRHDFCTLKNDVKLHYITNNLTSQKTKNVVILIHGFPDSCFLWDKVLARQADDRRATIIAVDLPGYGGSGGLNKYDPESVLEAMTGFILAMRKLYLADGGKTIMVTHDWGTIIGARLAAEARELADRWILTSAIIPQHVRSNVDTALASSRQMLHTYFRHPTNTRLLKTAFTTALPTLSQMRKSFYIFIINLPLPLANFFATFGNYWFLRLLNSLQSGVRDRQLSPTNAAHWMAASSGPSREQLATSTTNGLRYPDSVERRVKDRGMSEKIRIYREGLAFDTWEKSIETAVELSELPRMSTHGSGALLFEDGPPGSLQAPVTMIYGRNDPAFDSRLVLNGIDDYLARKSQVVVLEDSGHWLPSEKYGADIINMVLELEFEGKDDGITGKKLFETARQKSPRMRIVVEK